MDNPAVAKSETTVSSVNLPVRSTAPPGGTVARPAPGAERRRYPHVVGWWLMLGLVLIFVQVIVGGITRLTGSGLSITKWEIVTGTMPPLSEAAWAEEFALYQATPQYEQINEGMPLSDFKFIYFWEYFHRLWARMMGFAFILPLAYFLVKGYIDARLGKRLALVFGAAALTAGFGWIMVASGLIERPLVNAYKLSMHLGIAFTTFGILLWTTFWVKNIRLAPAFAEDNTRWYRRIRALVYWTAGVLIVQILLGGMMSGMKAALFYPTWPDLNGEAIPAILFDRGNWTFDNFIHYDSHPFMAALVQVLHRTTGYLVALLVGFLAYFGFRQNPTRMAGDSGARWRTALTATLALTVLQVALGISTVVLSIGTIPVLWGVLHQAGALLLLAAVLWTVWLTRTAPRVVVV